MFRPPDVDDTFRHVVNVTTRETLDTFGGAVLELRCALGACSAAPPCPVHALGRVHVSTGNAGHTGRVRVLRAERLPRPRLFQTQGAGGSVLRAELKVCKSLHSS